MDKILNINEASVIVAKSFFDNSEITSAESTLRSTQLIGNYCGKPAHIDSHPHGPMLVIKLYTVNETPRIPTLEITLPHEEVTLERLNKYLSYHNGEW